MQIIVGPGKGEAIVVTQGEGLLLGRAEDCDLVLPGAGVSGKHARFAWSEEGFWIYDQDSRNGVYVNGQKVREGPLQLGDFIQLGSMILQLKEGDSHLMLAADLVERSPSQSASSPPGMLIDRSETAFMPAQVLEQIRREGSDPGKKSAGSPAPPGPAPKAKAGTANWPQQGQMLSLGQQKTQVRSAMPLQSVGDQPLRHAAELATLLSSTEAQTALGLIRHGETVDRITVIPVPIGRDKQSGIFLDDSAVSLRHAVLDQGREGFVIRDLGSANGTYVNGERVVIHTLKDGDIVTVGDHALLAVIKNQRLGIEVVPPQLMRKMAFPVQQPTSALGVVARPLADKKHKKKKKSELVWFPTSDIDRGIYRNRSAFFALLLGFASAGWLVFQGGSKELAGGSLATVHESEDFLAQAQERSLDRCSACHEGMGVIEVKRCENCHSTSSGGTHASKETCTSCHLEHKGAEFTSSRWAQLTCQRCHETPHEKIKRLKPQLVKDFRPDAPADLGFHERHHIDRKVKCQTCHGAPYDENLAASRRSCGQCHAPDKLEAENCQQCHFEHPNKKRRTIPQKLVKPKERPRFVVEAAGWALGLIALPFLLAAVIGGRPRRSKVLTPEKEDR